MAERIYRKLEGMTLDYVDGKLEESPNERAIRYTVTFDMRLDFTHFVQMANLNIPGYLHNPVNAIRPELDGLAYHYSYNYLFGAAGSIHDNKGLFELFTSPLYYMNQWATGADYEVRYGKPMFEVLENKLRITACKDIRLLNEVRQIEIDDLPIFEFHWALNLLQGHLPGVSAPVSVIVLMYMNEDFVEVGGQHMFRGTRYINGKQLSFGSIKPEQVLTAQ
ncbi:MULTISPECIES: hypothetical protein [Pseudomonas]|uniref:Uncharacterized protein n=1 Tax=Pseudomonas baetica TaxID=674054 RepID=A0ABX4PS02_9PSED|nr:MULTISPECIES: hypothetical protein [Pseudomonas]MDR9862171.1 hypothetical protein [Pseudomonas baetica]PKA67805.1 hypothetical protein ATI02_0513 [Pseudomonas baetica]PTC18300.1 hypothetical protein C0J26_20080 [Pseudomonas baetica]